MAAPTWSATVQRFNRFAKTGKDEDFHRGDSAYDRFYGDPSHQPNPCLGPLTEPPFYGTRLYPGDIGTKGGLLTYIRDKVAQTTAEREAAKLALAGAGGAKLA